MGTIIELPSSKENSKPFSTSQLVDLVVEFPCTLVTSVPMHGYKDKSFA